MKGAVETIAQACGLQPPAIEALEARVRESALKGYRTLAVARVPETGAPILIGLVTLYDPPRPDAKQLIAVLHDLGVPVKMLTGDALAVASEIARGVGLPNIRRMADLKAAGVPAGKDAVDLLAGTDGFAEIYPEDKYVVVKHLQAAGHVTGMTGDGVNDAPALRQAEVGIAVSTATDVAKGAASVVLTEPGLTNIVALVEQGRTIYQRILTYIINKISRTILKTAFVAIAFVVTGKFVMSAFAMLLLVFITDFAKISLATDHVRSSRKPETWNIGPLIMVSGNRRTASCSGRWDWRSQDGRGGCTARCFWILRWRTICAACSGSGCWRWRRTTCWRGCGRRRRRRSGSRPVFRRRTRRR